MTANNYSYRIRTFLKNHPGSTVKDVAFGLGTPQQRDVIARIMSNMLKAKVPQVTREDGKYTLVHVPARSEALETTRRLLAEGLAYEDIRKKRAQEWKAANPDRIKVYTALRRERRHAKPKVVKEPTPVVEKKKRVRTKKKNVAPLFMLSNASEKPAPVVDPTPTVDEWLAAGNQVEVLASNEVSEYNRLKFTYEPRA